MRASSATSGSGAVVVVTGSVVVTGTVVVVSAGVVVVAGAVVVTGAVVVGAVVVTGGTHAAPPATGFTKQIDQIGALIQATGKATDDKIDDLKTRLNSIEGRANAFENRSTGKVEGISTVGVIMMGIVAGLSALVAVATLAFNILR